MECDGIGKRWRMIPDDMPIALLPSQWWVRYPSLRPTVAERFCLLAAEHGGMEGLLRWAETVRSSSTLSSKPKPRKRKR